RLGRLPLALEELHVPLVPLGRRARGERPQVPALAGPGIDLPRIEAVLARPELADHDPLLSAESATAAGGQPERGCRAFWAFLMFAWRARCCAGVGFSSSGTFGRSFAWNTSPFRRRGSDPS